MTIFFYIDTKLHHSAFAEKPAGKSYAEAAKNNSGGDGDIG